MKTRRLLFLFSMLGFFLPSVFSNVIKTVGTTGADFATLQLAFDDINNNVGSNYTGIIELQVIDNTTETVTAILNASANWTSVKIYPTVTGKSIAGDINYPLISLNGASNVTIDGRLHNSSGVLTGSTKDLTISNANTGTGVSTIFLTANASNNTVTYATIKGASTGSNGTIMMTTPSATYGMANNTFSYNLITGISAAVRPAYSVYARGSGSFLNKGNKIQNNEFKDFFNLATASNAIDVDGLSDTWTISGNSFYETSATFAPTANVAYSAIKFAGGRTHTISGNYIGGSDALATGTWTKSSTNNNNFTGIVIAAGTGFTSTITNNTIKNITWTSGTAAVTWKAIDISGGGGHVIITNNTIGTSTGTESIVVTNATTGSSAYGIHIRNTGNATCERNTLGAIKTDNATTNSTNLYGIMKESVAGVVAINNNIINNLTTNSAATTTGYSQSLTAIMNNGGTGGITIDGNSISNLANNTTNEFTGTAGSTCGIRVSAGANTITNNTIHDLTNGNASTAATHQASVIGIAVTGSGIGITNLTGNSIYNLSNSRSDFAGYVLGIHFVGAAGSVVKGNFIHSLSATSATAKLGGIRIYEAVCAATFSNNIISLGSNTASSVIGIAEALALLANYNTNYYHNTIYIYGTITAGTSICYYSASTLNDRVFKNNIFVNQRSGGGTHYSFQTSASHLTSDYNLYYVSGTGSVLANIGGARADLTALQSATGGDQNSLVPASSPFTSPGTTTTSYLPTAESTGVRLNNTTPAVTTDYMGYTRPDAPQLGALEIPVTWNGSWSGSNAATKTAIIDGNYSGAGFPCLDLVVNAGKQTSITSGTLAVGGNMTLKSDATNGTATLIDNNGSSLTGTLTVAGTTTVQQYLAGARNWYISSPVSAATSSVINANSGNYLWKYNEPNTGVTPSPGSALWDYISTTSESLGILTGYIAKPAYNGTLSFTGGTLNTGSQSVSLYRTATDQTTAGYNLVGNPYPSYLNWESATKTNLSTTIWFRSKNAGNTAYVFDTYNGTSHEGTSLNGTAVTRYIPPMQAFWVRVTSGTGTFGVDNSMRSHESGTNRLKAPALNSQQVLRLQVSSGLNADEAIVLFNTNASDELEDYDSQKKSNNNPAIPEIYTIVGNEKLAINGLNSVNSNKVLPLGFACGKSSNFTLKATEVRNFDADTKIYLKDNILNTEKEITDGTSYNFSSDEVDTSSRFSILFKSGSVISEIDTNATVQKIFIFKNANNHIVVNRNVTDGVEGQVTVCNAVGQQMFRTSTTGSNTVINKIFSPGVYIVTVNTSGNKIAKKVIVNY